MSADRTSELESERAVLAHILECHLAYLDKNRHLAERLAAQAAEAIEDGIRDIIDEDAEADAAIRAVMVRQSAQRAMYAARRVADLEAQGDALAFGSMTDETGDRLYVGRRTVFDGDDPLLVDWRARAAIPFYRATPIEPLGLVHRRHLIYDDPSPATESTLIDYSDEIFDIDRAEQSLVDSGALRGEAALLAGLAAPTGGGMRSVVATIQAEQDAVIRASGNKTLVVQGGPGTGKTVVALHRAAYLLYDQRIELADSGVLLVGPSRQFLRYIADVLPSLGESGVVSVTVDKLYRGASVRAEDEPAVAELKGRGAMVVLLAAGVAQRQRRPGRELKTWYGSRSVKLSVDVLGRIFDRARRHPQHNAGAKAFHSLLIDRLSTEVYDPAFHDMDDARISFETNPDVNEFLLAHFPPLSPEQALNDLLGSPGLLRQAGSRAGLTKPEIEALFRPRTPERDLRLVPWTTPDMGLLDELLDLLGPPDAESDESRVEARDERDEFELAEAADEDEEDDAEPLSERDRSELDVELPFPDFDDPWITDDFDDDDYENEGLGTGEDEDDDRSLEEFRGVVESDGTPIDELALDSLDVETDESVSIAQLAASERSWQFGHVIVDEAQDLTAMQWRMVARRSTAGALTIVGDLAQRSTGPVEERPRSWGDLLPPILRGFDLKELTVNYRSPVEADPLLHRILAELAPELTPATAIRSSGHQPTKVHIGTDEELVELMAERRSQLASGQRLAIVTLDAVALRDRLCPDEAVAILTPAESKGLEFESVIVVEPAAIVRAPHGLSLLYVALSRATSRLTIAHRLPLPAVLGGCS